MRVEKLEVSLLLSRRMGPTSQCKLLIDGEVVWPLEEIFDAASIEQGSSFKIIFYDGKLEGRVDRVSENSGLGAEMPLWRKTITVTCHDASWLGKGSPTAHFGFVVHNQRDALVTESLAINTYTPLSIFSQVYKVASYGAPEPEELYLHMSQIFKLIGL